MAVSGVPELQPVVSDVDLMSSESPHSYWSQMMQLETPAPNQRLFWVHHRLQDIQKHINGLDVHHLVESVFCQPERLIQQRVYHVFHIGAAR